MVAKMLKSLVASPLKRFT